MICGPKPLKSLKLKSQKSLKSPKPHQEPEEPEDDEVECVSGPTPKKVNVVRGIQYVVI